jgi:hypothetical protein
MSVDTPQPIGPMATVFTFTGIGSGRPGEPRVGMEDRGPVLIDSWVFDKRLLNRPSPRGLLEPVGEVGSPLEEAS